MTLELLVLGVGLMAIAEAFAIFLMGLILSRHSEQIKHLGRVCATLTKAWKDAGGTEIRVDPELLGASPDEVAPPETEDESSVPRTWERWGPRAE